MAKSNNETVSGKVSRKYEKGIPGKTGPQDVNPASVGTNPVNTSGGFPGGSRPQSPIPGPNSPGQPIAMKKALAKKTVKGGDATGFAGLVR
jgi:hypothetical protein